MEAKDPAWQKEEIKKVLVQTKKKSVEIMTPKGEPIIQGQKGILYKFAKCCNPAYGDKIKGYLTLNRGVSIHLVSCKNIKSNDDKRLLVTSWGKR